MKNIFLIIFMLVTVSLWSQAPLLFSSRLNVTNVTGSDPYTLTGVVQDELSLWSAADINAANDSIYHLEGSDLLIYRITSISSASGNNFVIIVDDIMNSGILPSTGTEWAAVEFTPNYQFPTYIGNLSSPFKAVIDNRFKQRLDEQLVKDSLLYQENSTTRATSDNTDNYHKGDIGIGDFSSDNIQAKLHLYDVAQAVLRISDEAVSDTASITFVDFWRGYNTSRLGRFGYLFNTDADLYFSNEATGGGLRFRTNAVDKLYISSGGALKASQYGAGTNTGTTVKVLTVDADGDILDDKVISDFGGVSSIAYNATTDIFTVTKTDATTLTANIPTDTLSGINTGRVLYVSKTGWKGTGTEQVGNPQFPWKTPWLAVAAASAGDLIHVFPDEYTMGAVASGKDFEFSSTNSGILWFNGTWFFEAGARIVNYNVATHPRLFSPQNTTGVTSCRVFGYLQTGTSGGGLGINIFQYNSGTQQPNYFYLEADSLYCRNFMYLGDTISTIIMKANVVHNTTDGVIVGNEGFSDVMSVKVGVVHTVSPRSVRVSNKKRKGFFSTEFETVFIESGSSYEPFFNYSSSANSGDSAFFNLTVKKFIVKSGASYIAGSSKIFGPTTTATAVYNHCKFNVNIGYFEDLSTDTSVLLATSAVLKNNTNVDIFINGYSNLGSLLSMGDAGDSCVVRLNANWTNGSLKPVIRATGATTKRNTYISGKYVSKSSNLAIVTNSQNLLKFMDCEVDCGNTSAINTTQVIALKNCTLLSGSSAPVISSSAVDVDIMGVYSNSVVTDADVTERIQSIVRNTNVK